MVKAATRGAGKAKHVPVEEDLYKLLKQAWEEASGEMSRFNLLAVGNTGAGKSSLINAMFGWDIAATGNGRPVTTGTHEYRHPRLPITFLDTRGVEVGESLDTLKARLVGEIERRRSLPVEDQTHVAWYCVRWSDRRLEPGQEMLIRAIAATGVPVILVLTQVPFKPGAGCHPDAQALATSIADRGLPLAGGSGVVMTAAKDDPWTGPVHGLQELLDCTFQVAPEGAVAALVAAQQVDMGRKREASRRIITEHASVAAGVAISPIPFADAAALVPLQVAMIVRITKAWGLDVALGTLSSLVGSALLTSGATLVGRQVVGTLLKLIPGIGSAAGGAISAAVASTLTAAVGNAWLVVVEQLAEKPERAGNVSSEEVKEMFRRALRDEKS